jgi:hypothetical protein
MKITAGVRGLNGRCRHQTLNVPLSRGSNDRMLHRKLLKAPARALLLTFVLSARMTVASSAATPQISSLPAHASRPAVTVRSRTRPETDYSIIEGVQRWGLNE